MKSEWMVMMTWVDLSQKVFFFLQNLVWQLNSVILWQNWSKVKTAPCNDSIQSKSHKYVQYSLSSVAISLRRNFFSNLQISRSQSRPSSTPRQHSHHSHRHHRPRGHSSRRGVEREARTPRHDERPPPPPYQTIKLPYLPAYQEVEDSLPPPPYTEKKEGTWPHRVYKLNYVVSCFLEEFKIMRIIQRRNPTENLFSSILRKPLTDATNKLQHKWVS